MKKKNAKIVVVDGLARSGTTLLSSLIHSQENCSCYRGVFHEFLACDLGVWKYHYALNKLLLDTDNIKITKRTSKFNSYQTLLMRLLFKIDHLQLNVSKQKLTKIVHFLSGNEKFTKNKTHYNLSLNSLFKDTIYNIKRRNQTGTISLEEWERTIESHRYERLSDLDILYQKIAALNGDSILAFRWNQGLAYLPKFLRNDNHYWITILRNPCDRAYSDFVTFDENYENSVLFTDHFGSMLQEIGKKKNHLILYFEDLIKNPEEEMEKIFKFLGEKKRKINTKNLFQQSGKPYRVETSALKTEGVSHTQGVTFKGFDLNKIGHASNKIPEEFVEKFQEINRMYDVFKKYR